MMTSRLQLDFVIPRIFVMRFEDGLAALRAFFGAPRRSPDSVVRRVSSTLKLSAPSTPSTTLRLLPNVNPPTAPSPDPKQEGGRPPDIRPPMPHPDLNSRPGHRDTIMPPVRTVMKITARKAKAGSG